MSARRVESFLLRLVVHDDEPQNPEQWRGRIQHVATGQEQQIAALQQAIAFIVAHLDDEATTALNSLQISQEHDVAVE